MKYVCVYVTMPPHYYDFDFKLTSDVKNQPVIQKYRRGRRFLTMVSRLLWLFKIWQVSSCGEIMQHLETCWLWQLGWQSFVSPCDVFNCLFPLDVQNEIQLLSRVFCYSWLVCLLGFWLRNALLVKVGNSDFGWHRFLFCTLLDA